MAKQPSLISVVSNTLRSTIVNTSLLTDELLEAATEGAKIVNQTAKYARASNAAWVAEGMSEYTAEERAFILMQDPTIKLPPVKEDTIVSEQ